MTISVLFHGILLRLMTFSLSLLQMLEYLVKEEDVDWSKVTCFHLDEYIGVTESHKASFVG